MPDSQAKYQRLDDPGGGPGGGPATDTAPEQQPARGPEYCELEVDEPRGFGDDDDARYYEEFSSYDQRSAKAHTWRRKRFSLAHVCLAVLACLGVYVAASVIWSSATGGKGAATSPPVGSDPSATNAAAGGGVHGDAISGSAHGDEVPADRTGKKLLTYDNVGGVNGLVQTRSLDWLAHPSDPSIDGLYREVDGNEFVVRSVANATWQHTLATRADLIKASLALGTPFTPLGWSVSADWEYMLFNVRSERVWRHSVRGTYLLYNIHERTMIPLTGTGNDNVQRIEWAPSGHRLQFVRDNNLFVTDMMHEIQITEDGSDSVFNGLADWVYEEEVLGSAASSLWSPDGNAVAYLRIDDSQVPVFQYELYHPENRSAVYPEDIRLHYPKPGAANPRVSLFVYRPAFGRTALDLGPATKASDSPDTDFRPQQITFEAPFDPADMIITNVAWLTDHSDRLIVYIMNRVQSHLRVYLVSTDPKSLRGKLVRERNTADAGGDGAWIEIGPPPIYVPANTVGNLTSDGYLDLVENGEHTRLALFSPPDAAQPARWLTAGDYDVVGGSVALNRKSASVSFLSTQVSSVKFNLYHVALNGAGAGGATPPQALTPRTATSASRRLNAKGARDGTYDARFSAGAGFYLLHYKGPQLPWQAVYSSADPGFELVLNDNASAQRELDRYRLPKTEFLEIANDAGDKMNAMAIYPPDFDPSAKAKYGVLFHVYGGPNSQHVSQAFGLDWMSALVSQQDVPDMPWIVARVDGRGTGYKGRRFRSSVSRKLGVLEPADQAAAGRYFQKQGFVNPHRIAIWGWSYGGYTTTRAIERHADVFRVGMAVAPVTDWRFYDSVYTERYLKTPQENASGYAGSAVTNTTGFASARFLVQHGTGDDNVHLQNTLALVDLLEANNVPGFEMAVYTDSDHSIYTHGVRPALYARMVNFLFRSFHELENKQFDYWRHADPNDAANRAG
ncbi:Dpp4p [Coemansia biformis]|uniref:Dpp4p n=1 Tax=Coemansia biformis TaxID=1286918 RepID=A0A9W8CVM5_9FUNG|nr:Dpp4p [Coemansia biformis]